jgi:polysaccharide export outer membrane protein
MTIAMRKLNLFLALLMMGVLTACGPSKDLRKDYLYFQDADSIRNVMMTFSEYKIRKDDVLAIGISTASVTQEQLLPFAAVIKNEDGKETRYEFPNYTVDGEGNIQLPLIGKVMVEGLTRKQAQAFLEQRMGEYISKPSVSVALKNFTVTLLGEVATPGRHLLPSPNATLLDALGVAGDITPFGNRKEILLMRKNELGEMTFRRLDITSAQSFLQSEYLQLNQNDVIYVPTNEQKIRESMTDTQKKFQTYTLIFTGISTLAIVTNIILALK